MPRPSQHTDRLLIQAARGFLEETGCSGLNLRQVAERAKVNLGMFHYHFGTKEEFCRQVLGDLYETFFKELKLEAAGHQTPLENLRAALGVLGRFARDNRRLLFALLRDAMNGEEVVQTFLQANLPRHLSLIARLVLQCKRQGELGALTSVHGTATLLVTTVMPPILTEGLRRGSGRGKHLLLGRALEKQVLTDAALSARIDAVLRGLAMPEISVIRRRHGEKS